MKIKIISRIELHLAPEGCKREVYDIYYGFTGLPTTWPFHTKWKLIMAGLSKEEMINVVKHNYLGVYNKVIIIKI